MTLPETTTNDLTLSITREIQVAASLEATFAALLEELGPHNTGAEGRPMPMKIEAGPGGRWFRDLGDDNGHLWGHVQAIKRPTLLEISGPLFMSYAAVNNLQYRLTPANGGTQINFKHTAFGLIPEEVRTGVETGWNDIHNRVRKNAESRR